MGGTQLRLAIALPALSLLCAATTGADVVVTLPPNIVVTPALQAIVDELLSSSQTFRDQCRRINQRRHVVVRVGIEDNAADRSERAQSTLSRYEFGHLQATIRLWSTDNAAELIGHEVEHVLEFAARTNYRAMAYHQPREVWVVNGGHFETRRAIEAGQRVASEVTRARTRND